MDARRLTPAMVLALVALGGCGRDQPAEAPVTPVVVQAAESYAESNGVRYTGAIEPNLRVDLAFKVGGYVASLLQVRGADGRMRDVQEGDAVGRGRALATLRNTDYATKRAQAMSQLHEAEISLEFVTQEFARAERLFTAKSLTKADYDGAKTKLDVTRTKVEGARGLVQEVDNAIADTALKAPIDGIVMKRLVEVGSLAGPGTPGFVLADNRQVKVVFGAPDTVVRTLKVGASQIITTAARPGEQVRGTITRIAPMADPRSRVFDVEVTIPNRDDRLKPGMVAALEVAGGAPVWAPVVVPLTAVIRARTDPTGYAIVVVEDRGGRQIAQSRNVSLGQTFGNTIEVTAGLKVGERVIVSGATMVADGEPVRIAPR